MLIYKSSVLQIYWEHTALSEFCNTIWQTCKTNGHTNNPFQLAMQQCCKKVGVFTPFGGGPFDFWCGWVISNWKIYCERTCPKIFIHKTTAKKGKKSRTLVSRKENACLHAEKIIMHLYMCPEKRNPSSTPLPHKANGPTLSVAQIINFLKTPATRLNQSELR